MSSFQIGDFTIGSDIDSVFVIAEIGQNHQGQLEIAKRLIDAAKKIGCNSVKFQKSCLPAKFTREALSREYVGENSWGTTYGEHKTFLEFSVDQYKMLRNYCRQVGILFSASAMDEVALEQLLLLDLPFIKIGSGDANNFPLLEKAALYECPLIISTGMQTLQTVKKIVEIMHTANKSNFALLHCVSSYPTEPEDCNLLTIPLLQKNFPDVIIGYSGHEVVPNISQAAVLLGAKIIERHITLDKFQRGSDHLCSLTPTEFELLIKDIRYFESSSILKRCRLPDAILKHFEGEENVKKSLRNVGEKTILNCELPCRKKLGKSLVASKPLKKGQLLSLQDIAVKVSEPQGIAAENIEHCIGKTLLVDLGEDKPLQYLYLTMNIDH